MTDDQNPAERALDLLVYGPLGLALYVRDTVPTFLKVFVSRGRSELESRRRKVGKDAAGARSLGETALGFAPDVRRRVEEGLRGARELAEQAFSGLVVPGDGSSAAPETRNARPAPAAPDRGPKSEPAVDTTVQRAAAQALAIPDYDELSASQVVERLDGLPASDLAAVRAYEEANRGRRTILFKIDQLIS
ncbi:MAG: hypothetical protein ACT4PI_06170 [Actinomycetota bacterium]